MQSAPTDSYSILFPSPDDSIEANSLYSTSPYAYVVFETIEAWDQCGSVGGRYTSITWSFAPGELSTIEGRGGPTKSFNFADLPCPPASVSSADWYNYKPGQPYKPVIAAVPQLFQLDSLFENCIVDIYEGYDPPYALTPAAVLATTTDPATHSTKEANSQGEPQVTSGPFMTPSTKTFTNVFNPAPVFTPPRGPPQDPHEQNPPIETSRLNPVGSPVEDPPLKSPTPQSPPAFQNDPLHAADPTPPRTLTPVPRPPAGTAPAVVIASQTVSQGAPPIIIGTNTIAYIGGSIIVGITTVAAPSVPMPSGITQNASPVVIGTLSFTPVPPFAATTLSVVIGGQTVSLDPGASSVVIGSETITAGSPPVIVAGTPISLGPGASRIVVGSSTIILGAPSTAAPSIFVVGSNTLTADPNGGFEVGGQTLTAVGPAITFSGTPMSLAPSGLVIGTQTYALPKAPLSFTVGGEVFTAAVTGLTIGGTTVSPGQIVTIDGTPVSLDPGGSHLVVGTSTVALVETTQAGLGRVIMSGFGPIGGGNTPAATTLANGTTVVPFLGRGGRNSVPCVLVLVSTSICAFLALLYV